MGIALEAFGDAAWRARLPEGANGRAVLDALRALPRVVDAVVSERHALIAFRPSAPPEGVEIAIECAISAASTPGAALEHVVRMRYDGPDLAEIAVAVGASTEEVIALHAGRTYLVAAMGFMPGFAYLRGLDARLVVPRRASPRARIAPFSVGIAGPYTGVYPFASPGGWNLVGVAIGFVPFDASSGARLGLGDRVRFVPERP
jgi:UPF0271 protein